MRQARRCILQPPATEMVPHTVLPRHIVDHVVAAYVPLAAADVVTPVEIGAMYATHPRKWRRALRFLFEDFPITSLRAADASACGVRLGVSTVPDAGLCCFVSRPDGFGAQHSVGSSWGPVVWHNFQTAQYDQVKNWPMRGNTDIRAVEDLPRDRTLTLVTTRAVAFGEELLVDYGSDFE